MTDILIRNLDDDVAKGWKAEASKNQRSLAAELRSALAETLRERQKADFVELSRQIRAAADASKMDMEAWKLIREDRDSR